MNRLLTASLFAGLLVTGVFLWARTERRGASRGPAIAAGEMGSKARSGSEPLELVQALDLASAEAAPGVRSEIPPAPRPSDRGRADLPLLVSGRVVDTDGAPIPRAWVEAGDLQEMSGERPLSTNRVELRAKAASLERALATTKTDLVLGGTDPQGYFELRGRIEAKTFAVRAERNGERSEALLVRAGTQDVLLTISRPWTLTGRLLVEESADRHWIDLRLESERATRMGGPAHSVVGPGMQRGESKFEIDALASGVYDLVCSLLPAGRQLARIPGIAVLQDTDLGTIDLRPWIQRTQLVLLGRDGSGGITGELLWRPSGSADPWHEQSLEGKEITILSDTSPVDVRLRPRGYHEAHLERVSGRRELALAAPLRVKVVLRTTGELPAPPLFLRCELRQEGRCIAEAEQPRCFTDENRELLFLPGAPGRMRVCWKLEKAHGSSTISTGVLYAHQVKIMVLDVPGEQVFPIELDGPALTELVHHPPW